jgi:hypothetical protein
MWLYEDLSFLSPIEKKNKKEYKRLEDEWGRKTFKRIRPDLELGGQWTNLFGEYICAEIYYLLGKTFSKPLVINSFKPDGETDDEIIEAKTQTYHTCGTAGEKILGTPFKYADVPTLYKKKLVIICIGGAEKICREKYGNLGKEQSQAKKRFLDFFKNAQIEYIGATEMLNTLICD